MFFRYEVIHGETGKSEKGKIEASSRSDAIETLKKQGLHIVDVKEVKPSILTRDLNIWLGIPVKSTEFVVFCRQLATLLRSGTTVVESLALLADQAKSKPFKKALNHIYQDVRSGIPLSEACEKFPRVFNKVFTYMIRAGEMSGHLDEVMDRLASFFEKEYSTREKVKSALTYPMVVSIIAVIVVVFLLTNIIPKLVNTLISSGAELPLPTAIVLGISDFMVHYWYILVFVVSLLLALFMYVKQTPKGKYYLDYAKLKMPIFGILIQKSAIARMSRTLASLFASAVPVLQSLTMVVEIVDNEVIAKVLRESRESLRAGNTLSDPLTHSWVFPKLVTHMISVGEETGQMDTMLDKIADFYEDDVNHMASRLSSIIEPLMIVILAIIVGGIVLAALLPMFEIYKNI
jgi:type IV pilus assembly protein PilC